MRSKQITKENNKNGGPYTKKQQEDRRIQVYDLHFEKNLSAVKIAKLLNVHRNTINEDIRFWSLQYAKEMNPQELIFKMKKDIQRKEIQRDRLFEYLEDAKSLEEKMRIEKSILDIDNRLFQPYSKMITSETINLESTAKPAGISEDEIKKFVRDLILENKNPDTEDIPSENKIKFLFIQRTKCDIKHAEELIEIMKKNGLGLCIISNPFNNERWDDTSNKYSIWKFAKLRGYLTNEELDSIKKKRFEILNKAEKEIEEKEEKEKNEKFTAKYGPDKSKWSSEIQDPDYSEEISVQSNFKFGLK